MYETRLFRDGKAFIEWAQKNVAKSTRANDMVGWKGAINYINLDQDLALLYQLEGKNKVADGVQQFAIEWQIHYLPWQFYVCKGTRDQLVAMLEEFDKHGIEPVETMARWKWCKMKGNT